MNDEMNTNQNPGGEGTTPPNPPQPFDDYQGYGYDYQAQVETSNPFQKDAFPPPPVEPEKKKKEKKEKKKSGGARLIAIALICSLLGGAVGAGVMDYLNRNNHSVGGVTNLHIDDTYNSAVEAIAAKDLPSVVGIVLSAKTSGLFGSQGQSSDESVSEGSGVVYKENGYIITNYHVVSSAIASNGVSINVYFDTDNANAKSYPATVVGYDASADLAVIKIDAKGLTPIEIGNSDALKVGQAAVAIGNPGGMNFMGSVSNGIVSGLNRKITLENGVEMNLIQTDAAINPGNSGGALVNGSGQLIGICSAKLASSNFEGMGFAIPVNNVTSICDNLIANEGKKSPYLGVMLDTRYSADILQQMGYPAGAVVQSVTEGSPAAAAGIKAGDIITKINGTSISSYDILKSELNKYNVGDVVTVEVYRLSTTVTLKVTLGETSSQ